MPTRRAITSPYVLYTLTGFTGLLAEQGFERYVTLFVGATTAGSAVIIFSYFLGFALGGILAARLLRTGRITTPLRWYGRLELLVGLCCVAFTYVFHPAMAVVAPWQAAASGVAGKLAVRFLFGCLFVLPVAVMMGASFPLIARNLEEENGKNSRHWTHAYSLNLAGACGAALLAPYWLIPALGIRGVMFLCCAICAAVFLATQWETPRACMPAAPEEQPGGERLSRDQALLLAAAFGSGAVFFALEVLWTHLITIVLGCSVYAFSSMLLMVLAGLFLAARRVRLSVEKGRAIFWGQALVGSAVILLIEFHVWDLGQIFFLWTPAPWLRNFIFTEAVKQGLAAVLIIPAAAALGTIFPSLLDSRILKDGSRTHLVGYLNAANSAGCLVGAALGLFVLIPGLGAESSMKLMIALLLALGCLATFREQPQRMRRQLITGAAVLAALFFLHWNRFVLTSGANVYFGSDVERNDSAPGGPSKPVSMIFFHEDAQGGITTVVESERNGRRHRTLLTNGKFQGQDDLDREGQAQFAFSAVPSLFVERFDRALLIGLGTGHSASTLRVLGYRNIDIAELSAGIVEAARTRFAHLNERILEQPGVHTRLEDGRNVLLTVPPRSYDLVAVELTSIWFAGATNLYSREFYQLARSRLREDGVMQQWVQLHHIGPREVVSAIATMRSVFPHVSLWYFGKQGIIIGTNRPQTTVPGRMDLLTARLAGTTQLLEPPAQVMERVAQSQLLAPETVDALMRNHPVINTDHNRWIEYATPRFNASDFNWREFNIAYLRQLDQRQKLAAYK